MSFRVEIAPLAERDLADIAQLIAHEAEIDVALTNLSRIHSKFATLDTFPERGVKRDDLGEGVRTLAFERSLVIAYRILGDSVRIERVVSGRRELEGLI